MGHLHVLFSPAQCAVVCSTCHRCTNAFALAEGCHKSALHLTCWRSVVQRHHGWKRPKAFESPRPQQPSSSRIVNRHGHRSRYRHIPAAIEAGTGRCDTTVANRSERDSQRQNRHVEQHQHSTAERVSKTSCSQAIPNQRLHS